MKTKYIPAITTLFAAFVICIVTILNDYDALTMMKLLLAVIVVFYILGIIIRIIMNKILAPRPVKTLNETLDENSQEDINETSKEGGTAKESGKAK